MVSAGRDWQVRASAATTGLLAFALLGLVLGTAELAARSRFIRSFLTAPSVGSPSRILELQLANLDAIVRSEGGIDCIFLGNSLVLLGIDPAAFAAAYADHGGSRARCFNFAIPGITVAGVAAIARILAEDYHPRLLIYGLTARDLSPAADAPAIEAMPWVQYRWGATTLEGWLADHSFAYRYFLLYANRKDSAPAGPFQDFAARAPRGFFPIVLKTSGNAIATARAMDLISGELQRGVAADQMRAIDRFVQLRAGGMQLAVLEMPVQLPASEWPAESTARYRESMDEVRHAADRNGALFWSAAAVAIVPQDGWLDMWHMNARGAGHFSRWLGAHVAAATEAGELPPLALRQDRFVAKIRG